MGQIGFIFFAVLSMWLVSGSFEISLLAEAALPIASQIGLDVIESVREALHITLLQLISLR